MLKRAWPLRPIARRPMLPTMTKGGGDEVGGRLSRRGVRWNTAVGLEPCTGSREDLPRRHHDQWVIAVISRQVSRRLQQARLRWRKECRDRRQVCRGTA